MTPTTKFVAKSEKKITLKEVLADNINKYVEAKLIKILGNIILNMGILKPRVNAFITFL